MKVKNLLTAMAIPAMFAACSQDDFNSEIINNQGNLLGTPVKADFILAQDPETRVAWGTTDEVPVWEGGEQFSLFWHGTEPLTAKSDATSASGNVYQGQSNAVYTMDEDGVFRTPAITYVGKQIIVYPADKAHVSSKAIKVAIPAEQDGKIGLGNRSVFVSDEITLAQPVAEKAEGTQYAGYDEPIEATLWPLSSQLALNLNVKMTKDIDEVIIKKVTLKIEPNSPDNKVFAVEGNLYKNSDGNHTAFAGTATVNEISVIMPENTTVTSANNTCLAQIAFLPILATLDDADEYSIIIKTNYGDVTVNKAALVTNSAGKIQTVSGPAELDETADSGNANAALSFKKEFAQTNSWGEKGAYGKRIVRNVAVDMATAEIDDMVVSTSAELIDAYRIYDVLGKGNAESTREVNFILAKSGETNNYFDLTKAAYTEIAEHKYVTLSYNTGVQGIRLVNEEGAAFESIPSLLPALNSTLNKSLVLGVGEWKLDVNTDGALVAQKNTWQNPLFNKLINEGTLTLSAGSTAKGALETELVNAGSIKTGSNLTLGVKYTQNTGASLNVNHVLTVDNASTNEVAGNVTIDGRLIANTSSTVIDIVKGATVQVNGSLLQSNEAKINNAGVITLGENGAAIIQDNKINSDMGSIVLFNRNSQVQTSTNAGYIKLDWTEDTYTPSTTDAFNYLILNNNVNLSAIGEDGKVEYFEVKEGKTVTVTYNNASAQTFTTIFVPAATTLRIPVGSNITTTNTYVDGSIEVYGTYSQGTKTGNGVIYRFNN